MNKFTFRKLFTVTFLLCLLISGDLFAKTDIKIAIMPFSLDAKLPAPQMTDKIVSMISERLEQEGARTIILKLQENSENWSFSKFKKFGIKSGVDYILTGSVFAAGESISIDSKLVNIYEKENFIYMYADAQDFGNLFSTISELSKKIIGEVFHKKIITNIAVTGNKRVETDAIMRIIETQPGDIIKPDNISKDLKKIYEMGYFDDVIVKKQTLDTGVKVVFEITEKSTIRKVKFTGNTVYDDKELDEIIDTRTGKILNIHKLNSDVNQMHLMYTDKNYHNISVTYEIIALENSQADIVFDFQEGDKLRVEKITFEGNEYFSAKKIKKAMETSEKGFFSFFTSSGDLNETEAKNDVIRIESLYKNNGFIDTKVSDPVIDIGEKFISIHFKIDEGSQYKIKKIALTGDLIIPEKEIFKIIQSKEADLYNRENIRKDILSISDIYSGKGFANVNVTPLVNKNDEQKTMDINYSINKGEPVYFNRINISGNLKTRDKVIRRELKIAEQDLYSKEKIQKSFKNLNRLNYFKEIDIKPVKTQEENIMDVDVKVVERQTGSFSLGGGFSSADGAFFSGSIQERNLFGRGQSLGFDARISQEEILYSISFFEPYIMDSSVSGGIRLYKEDKEFEFYDKEALGLTLKLGYRIFEDTNIGINYNIEDFEINNVETANTNVTPGSFLTSSIKPYIQYDSRDDFFLPTQGAKHKFSVEYAGEFLGGDIDYTKYLAETGIFFPLFWKFTGSVHAEAGYLDDRTGNNIDLDYERFYLGGMNSVRGFDKYDIGVHDPGEKERGGEQYIQFNAEITFPFTKKYKIAGVFFYDRGDVYRTSESYDLGDQFSSVGTGIRWNSPMGPLRIEYGWVLDGKNVKERGDGQFEFSVGASF